MEALETKLRVQNRTLKQIKRQGQVALYALCGPQGSLYGYELIVVKIRKAGKVFGKSYPEREAYPSNEDWGSLAWSYGRNQQKEALEAFETLALKLSASIAETDLVAG
jgi:hypothetical protein